MAFLSASVGQRPGARPLIAGFDSLRVLALVLVTWQHAASVLGHYETTQWRGISPGQSGVAIFCAIAGALAFHEPPGDVGQWLKRRLLRLFPAYWIVTLVAFGLTFLASDKPATPWLFVSQMLGLGYFTHGWALVNVVSWFLSLILLCYCLAAAAWASRRPVPILAATAIIATLLLLTRFEVALSRHVLAFALAALAALGGFPGWMSILGGGLLLAGIALDPQFFYAGLALVLIWLAGAGRLLDFPGAALPAAYSYEYFLVHGIALGAAVRLLGQTPLALMMAIPGAMVAAAVLHWLIQVLMTRSAGKPAIATPPKQRISG
ncbi:MAG: acyltransferase family protein [Betaproteobacteria bacterium]